MKVAKKIAIALVVMGIAIQFVRPKKNVQYGIPKTDIANVFAMPVNISGMLRNSCYDCHSNNTHYPWYSMLQPAAWYMSYHIRNGKKDLNFNEFENYSLRKQQSKLRAIANSMEERSMPINSYLWIHKDARLSKEQRAALADWASATKDTLEAKE